MSSNPFKGRTPQSSAPVRVLYRFEKPSGHWAEIRERTVTQWRAIEFLAIVDGSLLESQMFHNGREVEYPKALEQRVRQFLDGGWKQVANDDETAWPSTVRLLDGNPRTD